MDTTSYIALSRQTVLQRQLTNIAHNIANSTTTGFQAEHMVFETYLERSGEPRKLAYVQDVATIRQLDGGPIIETGNDLDLAIDGNGYFPVQTGNGVGYTRAGQFQLNTVGQIVTPAGMPLLDQGNQPITVPPGAGQLSIADDGTITSQLGVLGRIAPVTFANEQAMERVGDNILTTEQAPIPAADAAVKQGYLENSNVQSILEITRLMDTVRAFEGTQRMIETHHELSRRTVERVLSSGG